MENIAIYPEWTENHDLELSSLGYWSIRNDLVLYVTPDKKQLFWRQDGIHRPGGVWNEYVLSGSLQDVDIFLMETLL